MCIIATNVNEVNKVDFGKNVIINDNVDYICLYFYIKKSAFMFLVIAKYVEQCIKFRMWMHKELLILVSADVRRDYKGLIEFWCLFYKIDNLISFNPDMKIVDLLIYDLTGFEVELT